MSTYLWALLIDISGSMSEPFSGKDSSDVIVEKGAYNTKLEAAKDQIIRAINGLPKGDTVVVIAFSDDARLVCKGSTSNTQQFEKPIMDLRADGNTNISSAILLALSETPTYERSSFLLLSDGLSNAGDPIAAAKKCADRKYPIEIGTILIDPTGESEKLAKEISNITHGRWSAVTSTKKLEAALVNEQKEFQQLSQSHTFVVLITAITAVFALLASITGIYTAVAEKPLVIIPETVAALSTIGGIFCFYLFFAKEERPGFHRNPNNPNLPPPPIKASKYSDKVRRRSLVGGVFCFIFTFSLIGTTIYLNLTTSIDIPTSTPTPTSTPRANPSPTYTVTSTP